MSQLGALFPTRSPEALSFSWSANSMLHGVRTLAVSSPIPHLALALLCGHGIECALKALLAQSGIPADRLRKKPYGHDLVELWKKTSGQGFNIESPPPVFLECLNLVYSAPYHLRYPLGGNSITLPSHEVMQAGLEELTAIVYFEVLDSTFGS
jgi:hypothetical protein